MNEKQQASNCSNNFFLSIPRANTQHTDKSRATRPTTDSTKDRGMAGRDTVERYYVPGMKAAVKAVKKDLK